MQYYKILDGDIVLAVLSDPVWVKLNDRGRIVRCDVREASGVLSKDGSTIYHIAGASALGNYKEVSVADISEAEYIELAAIMDLGGTVSSVKIIWSKEETDVVEVQDSSVEEFRTRYMQKLSEDCNNAICNGVDVELSDGSVEHFAMTVEDQLNMLTLSRAVADGADKIPYHPSGGLCTYYSAEDFLRIVEAADKHKLYHTSYFNSLKNWVLSITSIPGLLDVYYGIDIPREYCSEVFLRMQHN